MIGGIFGLFVKGTLVGRALAALSVLVTVGSGQHVQLASDGLRLRRSARHRSAGARGRARLPDHLGPGIGIPAARRDARPIGGVVAEDDTAVLPFGVSAESSTAHEGGEERSGTAVVEATRARQDRRQLGELIARLLGPLGRIPGAAGLLTSALDELTEAIDPSGPGVLEVPFHPSAYRFLYEDGFWTLRGYTCDGLRSTWTWHAEDEIGGAVITWDGRQRASIGGSPDAPTISPGPLPVENVSMPIENGAEECG